MNTNSLQKVRNCVLIEKAFNLWKKKSKLVRLSDASFLQIIDKLINSNSQLNEINSKLIEFSNSKENELVLKSEIAESSIPFPSNE